MKTALSLKVKLSYGVGDFGTNVVLQFISIMYLFFLTDVYGINPATAGIILLVARLWDAITDPMMGSVIDATRSRWGKKRPYLLFGAIPLGISFFLLFSGPSFDASLRVVWALGTYILFNTAMTVVNIPYSSLTVSITHDADERTSLTTWRMAFALLGTLIAGGLGSMLVDALGGGQAGFRSMGILNGVLLSALILVTFFGVREVPAIKGHESPRLLANIKAVFSNRPYLILVAGSFFVLTAVNLLAGIVKYFFTYNISEKGWDTIGLAALFVSALLFLPLLRVISEKQGKKSAYLIALSVFVLSLASLYLAGTTIPLIIALFVLCGLGISSIFLMPWSMVADTIEYAELHKGIRPEGAMYGYFLFMIKCSQASAGFLQGMVLETAGYKANLAQSEQALHAIRIVMSILPAGLVLIGLLIILRYPITQEYHRRLLADIAKRAK